MTGRPMAPRIELSGEEIRAIQQGGSVRISAELQVSILGFKQLPRDFTIEIVAKPK